MLDFIVSQYKLWVCGTTSLTLENLLLENLQFKLCTSSYQ